MGLHRRSVSSLRLASRSAFNAGLTPKLEEELQAQDEASRGAQEGILMSVETHTGEILAKHELSDLPRWGGLAIANGRLF